VPVIRSFDVERDGRSIRFRGAVPGKLIREGAKRAQAHKQKSN
jgi:hypothetical protein